MDVHHDMTAPLSHYYIFTGHNSYLTGNQLSSDCSDVPIIKALRRGVRAIELDMWPNSTKDDIDILHGRTLTAPVQLIKCLTSIKKHAFVASPYPVLITLEDHLTPSLQAKVAEMLIETFGEMLFYPEADGLAELPSPEALKYRIIISTKAPKEYLEAKIRKVRRKYSCKEKVILDEEDAWGAEAQDLEPDYNTDDKVLQTCKQNGSDQEDDDLDDGEYKNHKKAASHYKRLIAIRVGKRKGRLKESLGLDNDEVQRLSLSEQELAKATVSHGIDLVRFTQRNLLRIYPKGTRVDSSNYNPLIAWAHGAQMVAFNMQRVTCEAAWLFPKMTCAFAEDAHSARLLANLYFAMGYGKSLWVMHGFFRANGGCGYVKKPDFLVENDPSNMVFNPSAKLPVRVYMGDGWRLDFSKTHFDAYSPPDFYIKVGIAGVPADSIMKKTQVIEDEWCPVWDEEFTFPLTVPELAVLRIEVYEYDRSDKDDFGGQTCLPILELRSGIRAIPIFDRKGEKYKSVKLLMRFEFF
ncbi:hypothetical protein ACLOJK_031700 [Asimina triloba]